MLKLSERLDESLFEMPPLARLIRFFQRLTQPRQLLHELIKTPRVHQACLGPFLELAPQASQVRHVPQIRFLPRRGSLLSACGLGIRRAEGKPY